MDPPRTTKSIFLPTHEAVWQQLVETNLINIRENSNTETHKKTHTTELPQSNDVESQMSPIKATSPPNSGPDTELFRENQTRNTPVQCLKDSLER